MREKVMKTRWALLRWASSGVAAVMKPQAEADSRMTFSPPILEEDRRTVTRAARRRAQSPGELHASLSAAPAGPLGLTLLCRRGGRWGPGPAVGRCQRAPRRAAGALATRPKGSRAPAPTTSPEDPGSPATVLSWLGPLPSSVPREPPPQEQPQPCVGSGGSYRSPRWPPTTWVRQ